MKNTFQNLVRIIIIGSFKSLVECHQQYLAVPPPAFINSPIAEPVYHAPETPVFYPDKTVYSLPLPYQNVDFLSLPQLFFQDQNYRPPSEEKSQTSSFKHYLVPPHQKPYQPPYSPPHKKSNTLIDHKKISSLTDVKQSFPGNQKINIRAQKEKVYPTLVYKKEKIFKPPHQVETSNENLEDDYSYNYSDDLLPPSRSPLLNYPYQHFRPVKPSHVNNIQSFSSCFNSKPSHSNLEKASTDLKAPITFLPSRFPPRIEELLQRIQNYFSTYTEQELQNPIKNTTSSTTISVPQATVSESPFPIVSETVDSVDLSKPSENKEPNKVNTEEGNESSAIVEMTDVEPVTEQEKIETISNEPSKNKFEEQISSTVTDGPIIEQNNYNNNKSSSIVNEVSFSDTTLPGIYQGSIGNQEEIISFYPHPTSTEAFYLSKNSTQELFGTGEYINKFEKEFSDVSNLGNGLKESVNHMESYNQNVQTDFSKVKSGKAQNENKTVFHDIMTTTNEIDHRNLTQSS